MATATATGTTRYAFRNNTQGWLSAVKFDYRGDPRSVPVRSGEIVSLSAEEQRLTAEAHADPKDNPFVVRRIQWRDTNDPETVVKEFDAPLLEYIADHESAARPIGVTGQADTREEGGTPDVPPVH